MMECITRNKYKWIAAAIVLGFWWGMSQLYSPLVVPPIGMVAKKIIEILTSRDMWGEIAKTVLRLLAGLGIGVGIGIVAGQRNHQADTRDHTGRPAHILADLSNHVVWI